MNNSWLSWQRFTLSSSILLGTALAAGCSSKSQLGQTANSSFSLYPGHNVSAIDVLLMVDNSEGMADKQATLAEAVPQLLAQLVQPNCVDVNGQFVGPSTLGSETPCPAGSSPEFKPINDIHIGIVTSSLGDHGAQTFCTPGLPTQYVDNMGLPILFPPDVNDMSHLVGTLDRAAAARADGAGPYTSLTPFGFLAWGDASLPLPGSVDLESAVQIFRDLVAATAESGCGYESQLESWFRFLIDPVPPILPLAAPNPITHYTTRQGSDDALLNQRAAFLRPDSTLAIIMVTDENDCSIRDTEAGWVLATTSSSIFTGSAECATNPNDPCCYSCTAGPPMGCTNTCPSPVSTGIHDGPQQASIRCWNQKRRFGYEFLYPTSRYVVGLTKPELCPDQSFGDMDCDCAYATSIGAACSPGARRLPNPLYSTVVGQLNDGQMIAGYPNSIPRNNNSRVYLMGIVGVPWQDIGVVGADGVLNYIPVTDSEWALSGTGTQPANPATGANGIWGMIYGNDAANIAPNDAHMVESITPRPGLPGPTAAAGADPIHGHEYNTALEDFEYACTYSLPTPRPCACDSSNVDYVSCRHQNPNDCCEQTYVSDGEGAGPGGSFNKPVCNNTTQVAAKAYPGLRELAVLHDYASSPNAVTQGNSVVASICPADLASEPSTSAGYGYNPAVSALMGRMKVSLKDACFPQPMGTTSDGSVACTVLEAIIPPTLEASGLDCPSFCSMNGRTTVQAAVAADATARLRASRICDLPGAVACASMCLCGLPQETGSALSVCQNATDGSESDLPPGFCYVDPEQGAGNEAVVASCPLTQKRKLRFAGNNPSAEIHVPLASAYVLMSCASTH